MQGWCAVLKRMAGGDAMASERMRGADGGVMVECDDVEVTTVVVWGLLDCGHASVVVVLPACLGRQGDGATDEQRPSTCAVQGNTCAGGNDGQLCGGGLCGW